MTDNILAAGPGLAESKAVKPGDTIAELLLDALKKLADAGEVEAACRIAGKAFAVLRKTEPGEERRFNVLLHRLTPRLKHDERRDGDE